MDSGIYRPQNNMSVVPLRMADSELIYQKEIEPNVSLYAIKALKERFENMKYMKKMLEFLSIYTFDIGCISFVSFLFIISVFI